MVAQENWRELLLCKVCGTHWRIDAFDKFQERFAWKVGKFRSDWALQNFSDREKHLLLQQRGGETEEECAWQSCRKNKVHGVAYCIDHLYAMGVRK